MKSILFGAFFPALLLMQACQPSEEIALTDVAAEEKKIESKHLLTLTSETFQQEVLESEQLVMVDFWAPWCPPCLELAPTVSSIADDYAGKVKVGKVDVNEDVNNVLRDKYASDGVPLILFFKGGKIVEQNMGLMSKSELEVLIKKHL